MRSERRGKSISAIELTNVSRAGFWLMIQGRETFLSFAHFPWFEHATIAQLGNVELPNADHIHWPDLDVDLSVDSIEHPERYPLVSLVRPGHTLREKLTSQHHLRMTKGRRSHTPSGGRKR